MIRVIVGIFLYTWVRTVILKLWAVVVVVWFVFFGGGVGVGGMFLRQWGSSLKKFGNHWFIVREFFTFGRSCLTFWTYAFSCLQQMQLDDLYHKHTIYSQGEELFGLPKTEEHELQRVKKEMTLLQKLYGLYTNVNTIINSYYELSWSEVDCEKINAELTDLQNRFVSCSWWLLLFCG